MITPKTLPTLLAIGLFFISPLLSAADNWQYYQDKAMALYQKGDYIKAENNAKYAAKIAKKADNGKAFHASSLNLLAFIQIAQGEPDIALLSINHAIELTKSAYDDEHPQVATLLFNKGNFLEQVDQPQNAIEAYSQAWDIQKFEDVQKDEILKTLNALTRLNNEAKRYTATISIAEEFTKGRNNEPFSELFRQINYSLADAQTQLKQLKAAQQTLNQELNREQSTLKNDDVRLAETLERLALTFDAQGQQNAAQPLRQQAIGIRAKSTRASLANVMNLNELALNSQQTKDYVNAKALYKQALDELHELNHDQGIEQALILGNLGSLEEAQGNKKDALILYQQSLALHDKNPSQPLQAAYTAARAGAIHYIQRDYQQAEPLFLQSLTLMEKAQASVGSRKVSLENLISLYDAWHKSTEKLKYLKQLKALNKYQE